MRSNNWNLKLFYKSIKDPQIEKDIIYFEKICQEFSEKYSKTDKLFTEDNNILLQSLKDYEDIESKRLAKPLMYIYYTIHLDSSDNKAQSLLNLFTSRVTKAENNLLFFRVALGKISHERQNTLLKDIKFKHFRFFLDSIFKDAKHILSESEEKIMSLKRLPAVDMWNNSHDKMLSSLVIDWKNKKLPIDEAGSLIHSLKTSADRLKLSRKISVELKKIAAFSEAEMNAVLTNKKIDDELRGFSTAYENTVSDFQNDPKVVELLVDVVTKNFSVSKKFYNIKAKILKLNKLNYCDREAKFAELKGDFSFEKSKKMLIETLNGFDGEFSKILETFIKNGQIDVYPKKGKLGGAYCWGSFQNPTFVLLNHNNSYRSYSTFAHEMGHAFHTEFSKVQGPIYSNYSTSLAETASTFFEQVAFENLLESLPKNQKIIALHNKINEDISTIFRQIACFNYEKEIHQTLRKKGFISKEEMADLHNKHMGAYLGPIFEFEHDDGYFFVKWGHIRRFFYVYSYAYGLLVSKVLFKKYKEDKNFLPSIKKFLSAGGKDTPENILKEIGIDVGHESFFKAGIKEIANDISRLEKMLL